MIRINKISKENGERAVATLEYLISHNDFDVLQPYVIQDLKAVSDSLSKTKDNYGHLRTSRYDILDQKMRWIISYFGLKKFSGHRFYFDHADQQEKHYILNTTESEVTVITGYDFMVDQANFNYEDTHNHYIIDKISINTETKKAGLLQIRLDNELAVFNINALINELMKDESKLKPYLQKPNGDDPPQYTLPPVLLSFTKKTKNFIVTFELKTIRFSMNKSQKINSLGYATGVYLIKKRQDDIYILSFGPLVLIVLIVKGYMEADGPRTAIRLFKVRLRL